MKKPPLTELLSKADQISLYERVMQTRARQQVAQQTVLVSLKAVGIDIFVIEDLAHAPMPSAAIPILVGSLECEALSIHVRADIARAMAIRTKDRRMFEALVRAYEHARPLVKNLAENARPFLSADQSGLNSYVGALETGIAWVARHGDVEVLQRLALDSAYGRFRTEFVVALARRQPSRSVDVLLKLIEDDDVAYNAFTGLISLKHPGGREIATSILSRPRVRGDADIRAKVQKYLSAIDTS